MAPSSVSREENIFSVSGWGRDDCRQGPWRSDSYGCDAVRGDRSTPTPISGRGQNSGSVSSEFGLTIVQQTARKFEKSGRRHKLYFNSEIPSTLLPRSINFRFAVIWSLKDTIRRTKFETRGNVFRTVRTWLHEQQKAWCRQGVHNCASLA
jgi:hypothetical protein